MRLKQKLFNYLNNLLFSSAFLWAILAILNIKNLKPEIYINLFFFLSLFLYLIFFPHQILKFIKAFLIFSKYIFANYFFWPILLVLGVLLDIFVLKFTSDLLILILTGLWILSVYRFKFKGQVSISLTLGFLSLCPFLLILKKELMAEKAALWAFVFLIVGLIQLVWENKKENDVKN